MRIKAYDRMQHLEWSKFRILAWKTISVHIDPKKAASVSLYDWFPIPGDPSAEEIKKINEERKEQDALAFKKIYDERLKAMANAGMNVQKTA